MPITPYLLGAAEIREKPAAQNGIASVSIALAAIGQARQFRHCRGSDSGQIRNAL
jgi:hypothetical protein